MLYTHTASNQGSMWYNRIRMGLFPYGLWLFDGPSLANQKLILVREKKMVRDIIRWRCGEIDKMAHRWSKWHQTSIKLIFFFLLQFVKMWTHKSTSQPSGAPLHWDRRRTVSRAAAFADVGLSLWSSSLPSSSYVVPLLHMKYVPSSPIWTSAKKRHPGHWIPHTVAASFTHCIHIAQPEEWQK